MSVLLNFRNVFMPNFSRWNLCIASNNFHASQVVQLYSPASLGIDQYVQTRQRMTSQFTAMKEKFLVKMKEFVTDNPTNMIFTEDLKSMVHIAEKKDLTLACQMISKFNKPEAEYRFGSFVFGPVVMRMFHYLDAPDEALQCFEEAKLTNFFNQLSSYQILLDLLYRHERYDDVLKVFEHVKEKQINMTKFPKYAVVLVMAACYKQNTPESLSYALRLLKEINEAGSPILRRSIALLAGLALKQGAPHVALEVISQERQSYITIRNIKATALAEMGRVDDALPVLRSVLDIDTPSQKDKHTFFQETVETVKHATQISANKDLQREFDMIEKALKERNLINEKTLDQLLTSEIQSTRMPQSQNQAMLHASYQGYRKQHPPVRQRTDNY